MALLLVNYLNQLTVLILKNINTEGIDTIPHLPFLYPSAHLFAAHNLGRGTIYPEILKIGTTENPIQDQLFYSCFF